MAITLNTITNSGLFNASAVEFQTITEGGDTAALCADLSDCKDAITVIVDIPENATGDFKFACIGDKRTEIELTAGRLNVFRITSMGLKKSDGNADFELLTSNMSGLAGLGVRIAVLKYVSVVNN